MLVSLLKQMNKINGQVRKGRVSVEILTFPDTAKLKSQNIKGFAFCIFKIVLMFKSINNTVLVLRCKKKEGKNMISMIRKYF